MPITTTLKPWLIAVGAIIGAVLAMMITFITVLEVYHDNWVPTEAKVITTEIVSSREGTLTWSLMANISYIVATERHDKSEFKILHKDLREQTVAEQAEWPSGKTFTIYVNSDDPDSVSLSPDGGREALAVFLAILTPLFLAAVGFPVYLIARRSHRSRKSHTT